MAHDIIDEANIPLDSLLRRIDELGVWKCRFIWWTNKNNTINAIKSVPDQQIDSLINIEIADKEKSLIHKSFKERKHYRGKETLINHGDIYNYSIQCLYLGEDTVISMLDYYK